MNPITKITANFKLPPHDGRQLTRIIALHTSSESFDVQDLLDEHGTLFDAQSGTLRSEAWAFGPLPVIVLAGALGHAQLHTEEPSADNERMRTAFSVLAVRMGLTGSVLLDQFQPESAPISFSDGTTRAVYRADIQKSPIYAAVSGKLGMKCSGFLQILAGTVPVVLGKCTSSIDAGENIALDDTGKDEIAKMAQRLALSGHRICAVGAIVSDSPHSTKDLMFCGLASVAEVRAADQGKRGIVERITGSFAAIASRRSNLAG